MPKHSGLPKTLPKQYHKRRSIKQILNSGSNSQRGEAMRNKAPKRNDSQPFDDSVWLDLFAPLHYARDTDVADRIARLLDYLSLELENGGPMGATNVGVSIENALGLSSLSPA